MANFDFIVKQTDFPNGQCPNVIKDTRGISYQYKYTDKDGNCHFSPMVGANRRRKKRTPTPPPPSCPCTGNLIYTPPVPPLFGNPIRFDWVEASCAISGEITNTSNTDVIPAPPPGGFIIISFGENGYPSGTTTTYTLTVTTDMGTCMFPVTVFLFSPPD